MKKLNDQLKKDGKKLKKVVDTFRLDSFKEKWIIKKVYGAIDLTLKMMSNQLRRSASGTELILVLDELLWRYTVQNKEL